MISFHQEEQPGDLNANFLQALADNNWAEVFAYLDYYEVDIETKTTKGNALMIACQSGRQDIIGQLLSRGADINAFNDLTGQTALNIACSSNNFDMVQYLVNCGADVSLTDIEIACVNKFDGSELIECLVTRDNLYLFADVRAERILDELCRKGARRIVLYLCSLGNVLQSILTIPQRSALYTAIVIQHDPASVLNSSSQLTESSGVDDQQRMVFSEAIEKLRRVIFTDISESDRTYGNFIVGVWWDIVKLLLQCREDLLCHDLAEKECATLIELVSDDNVFIFGSYHKQWHYFQRFHCQMRALEQCAIEVATEDSDMENYSGVSSSTFDGHDTKRLRASNFQRGLLYSVTPQSSDESVKITLESNTDYPPFAINVPKTNTLQEVFAMTEFMCLINLDIRRFLLKSKLDDIVFTKFCDRQLCELFINQPEVTFIVIPTETSDEEQIHLENAARGIFVEDNEECDASLSIEEDESVNYCYDDEYDIDDDHDGIYDYCEVGCERNVGEYDSNSKFSVVVCV